MSWESQVYGRGLNFAPETLPAAGLNSKSDRAKLPMLGLQFIFGIFGGHAFYARRWTQGIVYLVLMECFLIGELRYNNYLSKLSESVLKCASSSIRYNQAFFNKNRKLEKSLLDEEDRLQKENASLTDAFGRSAAMGWVMVRHMAAAAVAIFLIGDFIRIVAGIYKDGNNMRIRKWI